MPHDYQVEEIDSYRTQIDSLEAVVGADASLISELRVLAKQQQEQIAALRGALREASRAEEKVAMLRKALQQAMYAHKGDWQQGSGWEYSARAALKATEGA